MRFVWFGFGRAALGPVLLWAALGSGAACPFAEATTAAAAAARDAEAQVEAAASLVSSPAPAGLRAVWYDASGDPASILDRLRRAGLEVAVAIPPHLYYVRETGSTGAALPAGFSFRGAPGLSPARSESESNGLFQGTSDALPPMLQPSTPRRIARAAATDGLPFGARWFDTSEFMIGRVAVSILFPESDGSLDPNLYDWTPALRDSVVRSAVRGLGRWSSFAAARGVPLTFAIETHFGLATKYEPISRTVAEEDNWIQDMLSGYLGYKSDVITLAYDAANRARSRQGAQWAALLIAVQDDSSPTGTFPDGLFSHARLGGPYFVTPVKNAGVALGGATLDSYIEHEMAHIFWALDEHIPSNGWWSCVLTTGYLNIPNTNSVVPADGYCGSSVHCVMKGNYPDDACLFTQGQIGWADRNGNGKPDLLETRSAVAPDSDQYRTTAGTPITFRGRALEVALANQNPYHYFFGDSISAATVDSVVFSINHGPTQQTLPVDGVFDSGREYFTLTIPPLPIGDYTVEWSAWNSNGLPSAQNVITNLSVRAPGSPPGPGGPVTPASLELRYGPTPSQGRVRFTLRGKPASEGWGRVYDVNGREVARWRLRLSASGAADWIWTGRVASGAMLPSGLYFLSIEVDGAALKRRLVISH
jgi:hypothetical protein